MFYSSSHKRVESFGLVTFEKEESFYIPRSEKISRLYLNCKNEKFLYEILNKKLIVVVTNEHASTIINIGVVFSDPDDPIVDDLGMVFAKTKSIRVTIGVELYSIDNTLANEFVVIGN